MRSTLHLIAWLLSIICISTIILVAAISENVHSKRLVCNVEEVIVTVSCVMGTYCVPLSCDFISLRMNLGEPDTESTLHVTAPEMGYTKLLYLGIFDLLNMYLLVESVEVMESLTDIKDGFICTCEKQVNVIPNSKNV